MWESAAQSAAKGLELFAELDLSFETEPEPVKLSAELWLSFETKREPVKPSAELDSLFETELERWLESSIGTWEESLRSSGEEQPSKAMSPGGFVMNLPPVPASAHPSYYRR